MHNCYYELIAEKYVTPLNRGNALSYRKRRFTLKKKVTTSRAKQDNNYILHRQGRDGFIFNELSYRKIAGLETTLMLCTRILRLSC